MNRPHQHWPHPAPSQCLGNEAGWEAGEAFLTRRDNQMGARLLLKRDERAKPRKGSGSRQEAYYAAIHRVLVSST